MIKCTQQKQSKMSTTDQVVTMMREEAKESKRDGVSNVSRVPTEKPPFTLSQLKKSIPPHCFHRSVLRSSAYVVSDLIAVSALTYSAVYIIPNLPSPFSYVAWHLYWACQGSILHALWTIAHECCHHSFSNHQLVDDTVGFLLYSSLLVPYFSFKYSHRRHHSNTGSLEREEVFVPRTKPALPWYSEYTKHPPGMFILLFITLAVGGPMYLAFNASGRPYPRFASHYDPYSPIYLRRQRAHVFVSDAGVLAVVYLLYRLTAAFSLGWVVRIYGVPLLVQNAWVVLITYLQHTHPAMPYYDDSEWEWLRGTLLTVDRDMGAVLNCVFHNSSRIHVVHHLFPSLPHYNAMEATEAIKPVLGEYYRFDATPMYKAIWREMKACVYVESEGEKRKGVYWYHNEL